METNSKNKITTDASGKFVTDQMLTVKFNLVVMAEKCDKEWRAVVTSPIKSGVT